MANCVETVQPSTSGGAKLVSVDLLEFLLTNPKLFHSLPQVQKQEVVSKRPTPHIDIVQYDNGKVLQFDSHWYVIYDWLTGSLHRNQLFCFSCLIFGEAYEVTNLFSSIKNFHKKARSHEISRNHIKNNEQYIKLVNHKKTSNIEEIPDRDYTTLRRTLFKKGVQIFAFVCRTQNNYLRPLNVDYMKDAFDYFAINDIHFPFGWENHIKFLSQKQTQNQILEQLHASVKEKIKTEISKCDFVSVQIDDVSDLTIKPMFSLMFRYLVNHRIKERFGGFFDLPEDKTEETFFDTVINILDEWDVTEKLVCVSNDSKLTKVSAQKLQERKIMNLHSVNYNLNSVLLKSVIIHPAVKEFAGYVTTITSFFSESKREKRLAAEGFPVPKEFMEPGASIESHIWIIKTKFSQLDAAIKFILESGNWDLETTCLAKFIYDIFQNDVFVYLLVVFAKTFIIADHLTCVLRIISFKNLKMCYDEIEQFLSSIKDIQSASSLRKIHGESMKILPVFQAKNKQLNLNKLTEEVLRLIHNELSSRFEDHVKLDCFQLIDEQKYSKHKDSFPYQCLSDFTEEYSKFDLERLQNELSIIYDDRSKYIPARDLLTYFADNGIISVYKETAKFIEFFLTLPIYVTEDDAEKRIYEKTKKFARNYNSLDSFNHLGTVLIEEGIVIKLLNDEAFMNDFVDKFTKKYKPAELC